MLEEFVIVGVSYTVSMKTQYLNLLHFEYLCERRHQQMIFLTFLLLHIYPPIFEVSHYSPSCRFPSYARVLTQMSVSENEPLGDVDSVVIGVDVFSATGRGHGFCRKLN